MNYPKRYDLLDKDDKVLGMGLRPRKWARLIFTLTFLDYCHWKKGGFRIQEIYLKGGEHGQNRNLYRRT